MKRQTITTVFSLLALSICLSSTAQAQLFRNIRNAVGNRSQTPVRSILGNANPARIGGLPLNDQMGRGNTGRYRMRNNRVLSNGDMQWAPNRDPALNQIVPQPRIQPSPSPYAAGPTVGGRIRIRQRPTTPVSRTPVQQTTSGWQPWMHVPLDGSQPWNN